MKYPITMVALSLLGVGLIGTVIYRTLTAETCAPAMTYTVPTTKIGSAGNILSETSLFIKERGYRYIEVNSEDKTLTLYGANDRDKLIVGVDSSTRERIGFSFYDCRQGGNALATADAWLAAVGSRYIK